MNISILDYTLKALKEILAIDSPSGFTDAAANYAADQLKEMGYHPVFTKKGGVLCDLGGEDTADALLLSAHIDTLGAMVAEIKSSGTLRLSPIGGFTPQNVETENVRVYTMDGRIVSGTIQLINASTHVNKNYNQTERSYDTLECLLDEDVHSEEDVKALGVETGCFVCGDPRTLITESGYIKSRFLDDKLSAAILLGLAKWIKEENVTLRRRLYVQFTVYEETGHGASATMPEGVTEMLGVDMGCVGSGLACTEREVSICVKDASGPYNHQMTMQLIRLAKENSLAYAADVYPYYSSDCSAAVQTFDVKTALIGPGVYASHGYERSHVEGVKNTFDLLAAYVVL